MTLQVKSIISSIWRPVRKNKFDRDSTSTTIKQVGPVVSWDRRRSRKVRSTMTSADVADPKGQVNHHVTSTVDSSDVKS
jgi:hypothetical protein